jgi:hypothetical protein
MGERFLLNPWSKNAPKLTLQIVHQFIVGSTTTSPRHRSANASAIEHVVEDRIRWGKKRKETTTRILLSNERSVATEQKSTIETNKRTNERTNFRDFWEKDEDAHAL